VPIDLPDRTEVFIDANVFVYHFSGPTEYTDFCSRFLQRIEEGRLSGFTSTLVLAETLHRLMIIEAATKLQIVPKVAIRHLNPPSGS
jgi:predicted nucleic acid-binding protein